MNEDIIYIATCAALLIYFIGHNAGYNSGYEAGKCVGLPWQEQVECWRKK